MDILTGLLLLQDASDAFPLSELWASNVGFVIIFVTIVGAIGLASKNLSVGAMGAFLAFTFFAVEANIEFLETVLYISLVLVILGTSFKLWKLEGFESGS